MAKKNTTANSMTNQEAFNLLDSAWRYMLYSRLNEDIDALKILSTAKFQLLALDNVYPGQVDDKWQWIGELCRTYERN